MIPGERDHSVFSRSMRAIRAMRKLEALIESEREFWAKRSHQRLGGSAWIPPRDATTVPATVSLRNSAVWRATSTKRRRAHERPRRVGVVCRSIVVRSPATCS
jgi:hypothetical protein